VKEQALAEGMTQHLAAGWRQHTPSKREHPSKRERGRRLPRPPSLMAPVGKMKQSRRLLLRSLPRPAALRGYGWLAQI